jgi:hypothetical protein
MGEEKINASLGSLVYKTQVMVLLTPPETSTLSH